MRGTAAAMADLIATELADRDISQAEFCRRVGVSTKHLNQVLRGKVTARHQALDYWAFVLGLRFEVWLEPLNGGTTDAA